MGQANRRRGVQGGVVELDATPGERADALRYIIELDRARLDVHMEVLRESGGAWTRGPELIAEIRRGLADLEADLKELEARYPSCAGGAGTVDYPPARQWRLVARSLRIRYACGRLRRSTGHSVRARPRSRARRAARRGKVRAGPGPDDGDPEPAGLAAVPSALTAPRRRSWEGWTAYAFGCLTREERE